MHLKIFLAAMKWNLGNQNYDVIMPRAKVLYIKFNNNKLISLQRYATAQIYAVYTNIYTVVQRLSEHNLKISHHCHI
jgi:hypothetical protein